MKHPNIKQMVEMIQAVDRECGAKDHAWVSSKVDFGRALQSDAVLLNNALGWQLWQQDSPDYKVAAKLVHDLWFSTLALTMKGMQGHVQNAAEEAVKSLGFPPMEVITIGGKSFTLAGLTLHENVDAVGLFGALGYAFPALLERILVGVNMDWAALYKKLVGKEMNDEVLSAA